MKDAGDPKKEDHNKVKLAPSILDVRVVARHEAPQPNLGDHLRRKEERHEHIRAKGYIDQRYVHQRGLLVGVRCIGANGHQAEKRTDSQEAAHPNLKKAPKKRQAIQCLCLLYINNSRAERRSHRVVISSKRKPLVARFSSSRTVL